jgi:hypothetical protein
MVAVSPAAARGLRVGNHHAANQGAKAVPLLPSEGSSIIIMKSQADGKDEEARHWWYPAYQFDRGDVVTGLAEVQRGFAKQGL